MQIKDWVLAARTSKRWTQDKLGFEVGRTKANIGHWETGKHAPSYDQMVQISVATGYPMPTAGAGAPASGAPLSLEDNPDYPAIRLARFKLSAGASGFSVEFYEDDGAPIVFRREWFESNGYDPKKLFAIKVSNGSMEPGLYHGDTVVVNTAQTKEKDGVVFAVNYEGEPVVKRLVRDAGQWWLSSDNADQRRFPRKVCDETVFLIGEVVLKQSSRI